MPAWQPELPGREEISSNREQVEAEMEKERKRVERDNMKMSVHNKPIPMGYTGTTTLVQRTWSVSERAITIHSSSHRGEGAHMD